MTRPAGHHLTVSELLGAMAGADPNDVVMVVDGDGVAHPVTYVEATAGSVELEIEATPDTDLANVAEELEAIVRALAESGARSALSERARAALGMPLKVKPAAVA